MRSSREASSRRVGVADRLPPEDDDSGASAPTLTSTGIDQPAAGPERDDVVQIRPRGRRSVDLSLISHERRDRTKRAFTTRRVPTEAMKTLLSRAVRPRPGDLVLARVDRLGNHTRIELTDGRRARLYPGDEIILVYANRYAPDQFESYVPTSLTPTQLVASGGIASSVTSKSADVRRATDITPIGLVADDTGRPLNLARFRLDPIERPECRPKSLAVIGTSMNSGKTTTINQLLVGLRDAGHRPGVTKVTGTGSGGDYWVMLDAGAHAMLDFTDAGLASTFMADLAVVERTSESLIDHLAHRGCGSVLVEVADGVLQRETAHLLASDSFRERIDGVVFAAGDALGATGGVAYLRNIGLEVLAVAGRITRSPLATTEAERSCGLPVLTLEELSDPEIASALLGLDGDDGLRDVVVDIRTQHDAIVSNVPALLERA